MSVFPVSVSGSEDDEKPEVEEPYFVVTSDGEQY